MNNNTVTITVEKQHSNHWKWEITEVIHGNEHTFTSFRPTRLEAIHSAFWMLHDENIVTSVTVDGKSWNRERCKRILQRYEDVTNHRGTLETFKALRWQEVPTWTSFCRQTEDPKLCYIELLLDIEKIPHRRNGASFHAPILEVPADRLAHAMALLTPEIDALDDNDPIFRGLSVLDDPENDESED